MKQRKPDWLKVRLPSGESYFHLKALMRGKTLHTGCEEARCPNVAECWGQGTATFMILGDICTRACRFCAVKTGMPTVTDLDEPSRVAEAVATMGLRHAVITSVNRDDAMSSWVNELRERRGFNRATVAMANKNARIIWAVLRHGEPFREAA